MTGKKTLSDFNFGKHPPATRRRKTVAVSVALTPELHAELSAVAERHDVRVADVVRRACRRYLTDGNTATFAEGEALKGAKP